MKVQTNVTKMFTVELTDVHGSRHIFQSREVTLTERIVCYCTCKHVDYWHQEEGNCVIPGCQCTSYEEEIPF